MAVLQDIKRAVSEMPREAKAIGIIVVVVLAGLVVANVSGGSDHKPESPTYRANLTFCQQYATDEAEATGGLHSIGGDWWVDRVNDCLLSKD